MVFHGGEDDREERGPLPRRERVKMRVLVKGCEIVWTKWVQNGEEINAPGSRNGKARCLYRGHSGLFALEDRRG